MSSTPSSNLTFLNAVLNSEMATDGTKTSTAVEFPRSVDLGGDANLLVGPKGCQVRIRVCKALLCFASKYFNTLFSVNFSEGGLAEQGQDIILEEDEPDAVVNLCKILHMQYTWPKPMRPKELLHLGIVADKYGCVKAIHLTLEALFPRLHGLKPDPWEVRDLIVAAYLLDHPERFNKYTHGMLTGNSKSLTEIALSEMSQRIPTAAWCKCTRRLSSYLRTTLT